MSFSQPGHKETGGGDLTSLCINEEDPLMEEVMTKVFLNEDDITEALQDFNTRHYVWAGKLNCIWRRRHLQYKKNH